MYKDEDGLPPNPDVLRSIILILARQSAIARRSIDRLWEDQFIELCDDWAIPYIGDLVGTRLVHELNRRGRRVDVARTIFYRRRKGTPHVLKYLFATSPVGTECLSKASGVMRALVTVSTLNQVAWRICYSDSAWGLGELTTTRVADLIDGAVRRNRSHSRLPPTARQTQPLQHPNSIFIYSGFCRSRSTSPPLQTSARDDLCSIRLVATSLCFVQALRTDPSECGTRREWGLPAPIPCRLLGSANYTITADLIDELVNVGLSQPAADELSKYTGIYFAAEATAAPHD